MQITLGIHLESKAETNSVPYRSTGTVLTVDTRHVILAEKLF